MALTALRYPQPSLACNASPSRCRPRAHSYVLASKNAERDVLEVFEKRSDMVLKLEHIIAHRINWEPKPRNVASLARALNLGLDTFVYMDDNPVECALMRAELPQIVTLQVPPDDEIESFLSQPLDVRYHLRH